MLLDTHTLLWWCLDPPRLSARAEAACRSIERDGNGLVCAVSFWELAIKVRNGKLEMGLPVAEFAERVQGLGTVEIVSVDTRLWLASAALEWDHRDPADRLLVALARDRSVPLVTRDEVIRGHYPVCIW